MSDDRVTSVLPEEPPRLDTGEATSSDPLGRKVRLIILAGAQISRKYTLSDQSTIGRASTCTVPIDDSLASRVHASITRDHDGTYVLRDLSSRNGTLLNGRRATSDVIRFGDRIQIGSTLLLFSPLDPLEDRILQRQKLEAIGRLGAGIAQEPQSLDRLLPGEQWMIPLRDCDQQFRCRPALHVPERVPTPPNEVRLTLG